VTATFTEIPVDDVEAVSQTVTENEVMPGDLVDIDVTVQNNGPSTKTFDVTLYYDSVEIGTILVVDLAPGEVRVLTFTWDTTGLPLNGYPITAWADSGEVITEVDEQNNWCTMPCKVFVVPELPFGTILASLSMFGALIAYVGFKRYRIK
jgi:subtilase family serine protease